MALTLLEKAANVRQSKVELDAICEQIREKSGDWTLHSLAGERALGIGDDGLGRAWEMIEMLKRMARCELERLEAKP